MSNFSRSRRKFISRTTAIAATAASGLTPQILSAAGHKSLNLRLHRDIQILDPGYMIGGAEGTTEKAIMPTLMHVRAGDTWEWEPSSAVESLGYTDPTHIAFKLKPGLMWDGGYGEFTAEDVKFSYERMKQSEWDGKWTAMERVDIIDKYSGVIVMNQSFGPFPFVALTGATGCIVCKAAFEALGITQYTTDVPAQLGPYKMEWKPKDRLIFTPHPNWSLERPAYENINWVLIEDDNTAELAYEAGEVDLTNVGPLSLIRYKKNLPADTTMRIVAGLRYTWMGMNTDHPKLKDIRVRQAIQHAVDVDSILQAGYGGVAPKSHGIVPPGLVGKRNESKYSYNPKKAKELLDSSGVSGLSLTLQTLNRQERMTAAQIIQANLAEIGIQVEIIPLDSGPFWNLGQESKGDDWKDLQLWIMRYGGAPDPYDHFQWFRKDQVGVWNWERWSDDEFEDLYEKGIAETNPEERNRIYLRMGEIMEDTGAYLWITHEPEGIMHRSSIDPGILPDGRHDFRQYRSKG